VAVSGLREEQRGAARWLILDRPAQRNALSLELIDGLRRALAGADADAQVRAVALTGAGEQAFCAGMDLTSGAADVADGPRAYASLLGDFARLGKPLVAVVNGAVIGGGMGLLAACDLAVAAEDVRFATPEVDVGLFPYMALAPLSRCVGRRAALELAFTARRIEAAEARAIGLVNRVVPRVELRQAAQEWLDLIAQKSPTALRLGRRAFYATQDLAYEAQLESLCAQLVASAASDDAREGITAFLEKRKPDFKGT
jgi:enoyl-CoA hydratase/carnithine racemase